MKVVVTLALCLCSVIGCALWSGVFLSTLFYLVLFCTQLRGQKKTGKKKKFRESATFNVKLHTAHQIQPNDCHKHRVFTHPLAIKVIMIFKHSLCDLVFIGWDYALSLQLFAFFFCFFWGIAGFALQSWAWRTAPEKYAVDKVSGHWIQFFFRSTREYLGLMGTVRLSLMS